MRGSEGFWKLEKTIELLNYGGLRPCLCTPCGWPDNGSFSSNLPVSHTNCVLSRINSTQTTFLNNHVISGNHQSPPPSQRAYHRTEHTEQQCNSLPLGRAHQESMREPLARLVQQAIDVKAYHQAMRAPLDGLSTPSSNQESSRMSIGRQPASYYRQCESPSVARVHC
jgi:hypothetical protein